MEAYKIMKVELHSFITSPLDVGEWSSFKSPAALQYEKSPRYPLNKGLGGHM